MIVNDGGDVLTEDQRENRYAEKYKCRVTDKENLEASNRLFIRLVEEMHRRGMKVILDGVFNTVALLISGSTVSGFMKEQMAMSQEHIYLRKVHIGSSSSSLEKNGLTMEIMMAGGGTITLPKLKLIGGNRS